MTTTGKIERTNPHNAKGEEKLKNFRKRLWLAPTTATGLGILVPILLMVAMLLSMFGMAQPVSASQCKASVVTYPASPNIYYVGATIHYELWVENPAANPWANTWTRIWCTLPDGTVVEFIAGDLVQTPGQIDLFYISHIVGPDEIVTLPTGERGIVSYFEGYGYDGFGNTIHLSVSKTSVVIQPDICIEKTVEFDGDGVFGDLETAYVGDTATWKIVVWNCGDSDLFDVYVTDTNGGMWGPFSLAVGQGEVITYGESEVMADKCNTATAEGLDVLGNLVGPHDDDATVIVSPPVNSAPIANDDTSTTYEDMAVSIDVLANDTDANGDSLSVASVTQATNGSVVINADNSITYTPNDNFYGSDNFTYVATDGTELSNVATVFVTVNMAGRISGTVYQTDGLTPIESAILSAYYYDALTDNITGLAAEATSASDGNYTVVVPMEFSPSSFRIQATYPGLYAEEWYQEERTSTAAKQFNVWHGEEVTGKDFTLSRIYATPVGDNVTIEDPYGGVTITFNNVTASGETTIDVSTKNPGDDTPNFKLKKVKIYLDIVTTASYEGPITVSINYDDTGMTPDEEEKLRLVHWNGTDWEDVTLLVNTLDNIITGAVYDLSWFAVAELNEFPIADIAIDTYVAPIGTAFNFSGGASYDPDGYVASYQWDFGDSCTATGDNVSYAYAAAGLYEVSLTITDDDGAQVTESVLVVVYDPAAGFATGGGWIIPGSVTSEAEDMLPELDGTSLANFGFVVKYKPGATTPSGQLEFQYRQGDFNLHSEGMEWLVVVNSNWAKFQGVATIKGVEGLFPFRVDARDGDPDRLIMKIWAPGADPDETEPIYKASGDLMGGNIVIHTKSDSSLGSLGLLGLLFLSPCYIGLGLSALLRWLRLGHCLAQ